MKTINNSSKSFRMFVVITICMIALSLSSLACSYGGDLGDLAKDSNCVVYGQTCK